MCVCISVLEILSYGSLCVCCVISRFLSVYYINEDVEGRRELERERERERERFRRGGSILERFVQYKDRYVPIHSL